jgi:hypothetical protein
MAVFIEQACGCESGTNGSGASVQVSWCRKHGGNPGPAGLYCCGECGFRSRSFERLERHVYGEHLGAQVA